MTKYLEIGKIVNTFGIKGMVKVKPFTDDINKFNILKKVYIESQNTKKEYEIEKAQEHKNMALIKFKGIDTIEQANLLRDGLIIVDRENLEPLEEGTYYIVDLIGLEVYTDEGKLLGIIKDIYNTGSNDIYVIKNELEKEILLPGIDDVIKEIDIDNKKIIVHLLPGLI